jgi:predicted phosphodiesterase
MRALILSDIHANLEALTAVLEAAGAYDEVWNLGDVVGYGGAPNQVIEIVRPLATVNVRGNHDRVCGGTSSALGFNPVARTAAMWTNQELTADNLAWLNAMPQGPIFPNWAAEGAAGRDTAPHEAVTADHRAAGDVGGSGGLAIAAAVEKSQPPEMGISCVHGSPMNEDQYILNMRDAWAPLQQMTADLTFFGHTHVQGGFSRTGNEWREIRPSYRTRNERGMLTMPVVAGTRLLVNPGSVGQPRDFDWRAAFAMYDSDAATVEYHRVPYDLTTSQGRILMAGLPERLAVRLREGR